MEKAVYNKLLKAQRREITEHHIYSALAQRTEDSKNKKVLETISKDELMHYNIIKRITKKSVKHYPFMYVLYWLMARVLGLSFTLRYMEREEAYFQTLYDDVAKEYPTLMKLIKDSERHEQHVLGVIEETRIEYAGSVVLGLNDALVELSGALAGLTFALRNGNLIATAGLITGFAASLSMAASGYLQSREEADQNTGKNPITSAIYTGIAYIITVTLLVLPYLLIENIYIALIVMLSVAILIILSYTFYITTAKNLKFWRRFLEMAFISLGVAVLSFGVGILLRNWMGV
ncbi:MAG: VIT1/CCC1 transporter family protein, partial [Candidatus Woesearchaeota archaeon]|nr:VIT1/CCC1 transporter family protein [Candidatus Woesearchaeota archaeon]